MPIDPGELNPGVQSDPWYLYPKLEDIPREKRGFSGSYTMLRHRLIVMPETSILPTQEEITHDNPAKRLRRRSDLTPNINGEDWKL